MAGRPVDALLMESLEQQGCVQRARTGGRERQPHVTERIDEEEVADHVGGHRDHPDPYRRFGVLTGVVTRRQHLD